MDFPLLLFIDTYLIALLGAAERAVVVSVPCVKMYKNVIQSTLLLGKFYDTSVPLLDCQECALQVHHSIFYL